MTLAQFATESARLAALLDDAHHNISLTGLQMEMLPNDKTIRHYEQALDFAANIRSQIGANHEAEMAMRDCMACRTA